MKRPSFLLICIVFFTYLTCYAHILTLKGGQKIEGVLVYENLKYVYIYTKEGLKEFTHGFIIFRTNIPEVQGIVVPEEILKELKEFKKEKNSESESFFYWLKMKFEQEQTAKGLVKYKDKWVTPKEKETKELIAEKEKKTEELIAEGGTYYSNAQWQIALSLYNKAVELNQSSKNGLKDKINRCDKEIKFEAEQLSKGLVKWKGEWVRPEKLKADELILKADSSFMNENWEWALTLYKESEKLDPSLAGVLRNKKNICEKKLKFEREQKAKGLVKYEDTWTSLKGLEKAKKLVAEGNTYNDKNEYEKALALYNKAIKFSPVMNNTLKFKISNCRYFINQKEISKRATARVNAEERKKAISKVSLGVSLFLLAILLIVVMVEIYFIPTTIARRRHRKDINSIFVVNLFLGWTLLGWTAALAWALLPETIDVEVKKKEEVKDEH